MIVTVEINIVKIAGGEGLCFWIIFVKGCKILYMKKRMIITVIAILAILGSSAFVNRVRIKDFILNLKKETLPPPIAYNSGQKKIGFVDGSVELVDIIPVEADLTLPAISSQQSAFGRQPTADSTPEAFNLDVPFVLQAPFAVWDALHEDACEEASAIMAAHFILKKDVPDAAYMEAEILKIVDWENKILGFWKDTSAEETAEILRKFYGLKNVEVKYDIALVDIKAAVASGHPVILPAAGRELKNPYFSGAGPFYHMVVAKGYTKDKIITNDPGTRRGKDFIYNNDVLFSAIHDWNGGDVMNGRKAMIIVKE